MFMTATHIKLLFPKIFSASQELTSNNSNRLASSLCFWQISAIIWRHFVWVEKFPQTLSSPQKKKESRSPGAKATRRGYLSRKFKVVSSCLFCDKFLCINTMVVKEGLVERETLLLVTNSPHINKPQERNSEKNTFHLVLTKIIS